MDKITRRELKSDHFKTEVAHSVEYVSGHRQMFVRYGSIALGVIVLFFAIYGYRSYQHTARESALASVVQLQNATIGPPQNEFTKAFPSQAEKDKALETGYTELASKYPGSDEGLIGEFYLGATAADKGDLAQAEKRFKLVVDGGEKSYASLAKLSLAQVYQSQGKIADAEKLIRSVIDSPTVLVSKEQAIISLARLLTPTNPAEARKLLEPLRANQRSAVSRAALSALSDLPQK